MSPRGESLAARALPAALALPVLALALPSVLAFDPVPLATAVGWTALLALPAAFLLALAAPPALPRAALLLCVPLLLGAFAFASGDALDPFELRRGILMLALAALGLVAGSSLASRSLASFVLLAMCASLALTVPAFRGADLAGALGNTGALSQAALPGAVLGAVLAVRARGWRRALGAASALAFLAHASTAPVLAGTLAFGLALLAWSLCAPRAFRALGLGVTALALAIALALHYARDLAHDAAREAQAPVAPGDLGGVGVRVLLWQRVPALVAEHPLAGVGPGQFQATFPPHRDPAEIELSTHGRLQDVGSEVEHAHSDWLEAFAEYGLLGGGAFVLLFGWIALAAFRVLRAPDATGPDAAGPEATGPDATGPAAAAVLAVLVNAAVHAPLFANPVAALQAWVLAGAVLGGSKPIGAGRAPGRAAAVLVLVLLLATSSWSVALCQHGALLAARQRAVAAVTAGGAAKSAWLEEGRILRDALASAPDSPLARALLARHLTDGARSESARERARDAWLEVLEVRPYQVSALVNAGILAPTSSERRALWERARRLDPGHPLVLQNLVRFEIVEGSGERARELVLELAERGLMEAELADELGARALLAGRTTLGSELLARSDPEFQELAADELYALSKAERALHGDTLRADALECAAHRAWGLEHLASGAHDFAIAQFRQALRMTRRHLAPGDGPTRLLLAASLALAGREAEAREELATLERRAADRSELPAIASEALAELARPGS